ncbi:MAG: SBBP repeat-containing protein [Bacteroidota bacterium]
MKTVVILITAILFLNGPTAAQSTKTTKHTASNRMTLCRIRTGEITSSGLSSNRFASESEYVKGKQSVSGATISKDRHFTKETKQGSVTLGWVRHFGADLMNGEDIPSDIAIDIDRNVYVTGSSQDGMNGMIGIATLKYSPDGKEIWLQRFNGPGDSTAIPSAVTVDPKGNIFIAGNCSGHPALVHYDANGNLIWQSVHQSTIIPVTRIGSLLLDQQGNIYVLGTNIFTDTLSRSFLIKYTDAGELLWIDSLQTQCLTKPVIDQSGNLYLSAGGSLMKIDAFGHHVWERTVEDSGKTIWAATNPVIDGHGNIAFSSILADSIEGHHWPNGGYTSLKNYLHTITFSPNGIQQWSAQEPLGESIDYSFAPDISFDTTGNLFVAACFNTILTSVKYSSDGNISWKRSDTLSLNAWAPNISLSIEKNGQLQVAIFNDYQEYYEETVLLAAAHISVQGDHISITKFEHDNVGPHISISLYNDDLGKFYITGSTSVGSSYYGSDFSTVKFDTSGVAEWIQIYHGVKNPEEKAAGLGIDANGNVYIAGTSAGPIDGADYLTVKYTNDGDTVWIRRFQPRGWVFDLARCFTVQGNGTSSIAGGDIHIDGRYTLVTYSSTGDTLWTKEYRGQANAIITDHQGYIYTTGMGYNYRSEGAETDFRTMKFDAKGDTVWMRGYYSATGHNFDQASKLILDLDGNVIVAGSSIPWYTYFSTPDIGTVKYTSDGAFQWIRHYSESGRYCYPMDLTTDHVGNIVVVGNVSWSDSNVAIIIKYDQSGNQQWIRRIASTRFNLLAVDVNGDIYVAGIEIVTNEDKADIILLKCSSTGEVLWTRRYHHNSSRYNSPSALIVDSYHNLFITGKCDSALITLKYNFSGDVLWSDLYYYEGSQATAPNTMRLDGKGNLFIGATTFRGTEGWAGYMNEGWSMFTTIKYSQVSLSDVSREENILSSFSLHQNFPNPFNPSTTIRYDIPSSAHVKLTIHDILGREIATLVNEEQSAGWKEVQWNAKNVSSGIYLYKLQAGNFVESKKMLLMK